LEDPGALQFFWHIASLHLVRTDCPAATAPPA
jgi:hypothetical protein